METLKLPAILPGDLDLAHLNQKLHTNNLQLDWSAVISAPPASLTQLFQGFTTPDAPALGLHSSDIADPIAAIVLNHFNPIPPAAPPSNAHLTYSQTTLLEPQFIATEGKQDRTTQWNTVQGSLVELQFVPTSMPASTAQILKTASHFELRRRLEAAVVNDLLGPAGGPYEEIDEARVSDRYLVGLLAPLHRRPRNEAATQIAAQPADDTEDLKPATSGTVDETLEQQDSLAPSLGSSSEDGNPETPNPVESMMPSSIGMSFCIRAGIKAIKIQAGWGQYKRDKSESFQTTKGGPKTVWRRYPIEGSTSVVLKVGAIDPWQITPDHTVFVKGQVRKQGNDWIVTLFLINEQKEPEKTPDQAWLFQPHLSVKSADPSQPDIFIQKTFQRTRSKLDPAIYAEEQRMAMLYRNEVEFAVGHGVAVHARTAADNPQRAIHLETSVIPTYEVPKTEPPTAEEIPALAGLVLDMKDLAETPPADLPSKLQSLTDAYTTWIREQSARIPDPQFGLTDYTDAANQAIADCQTTLQRIQAGIDLLKTNPQATEAFIFMNQAMWQQRVHSLYSEQIRRGETRTLEAIDIPQNRTWRTFQLAFILLNLPSITQLDHIDRTHPTDAIADLLWFPTGGGKTEAYLGLTAYTIGLRRLQGTVAGRSGDYGIAVLMRYTLRLLTLQQFQRATALICACEVIRRSDEPKWGKDPFRIGLWVGQKTTPNTTEQSEEVLKQRNGQYQNASSGSPQQLTNCPWCGSKINLNNIKIESFKTGRGRTLTFCGDALGRCAFSAKQSPKEGLPVVVVDDEIYRLLPTLLIATVDKFAQMPWNGKTQMLFGKVEGYCSRHGFRSPEVEDSDTHPAKNGLPAAKTTPMNPLRPPDLIIQDELHLISGPLGTLVGLYETAIDQLCSWEVGGITVRPKVIASTATIRQAREQIHQLFLRKVQIFPPQGLDVTDNFFSRQRPPNEDTPGRRYLGISATGRRLKAALIRVYTAILAASQDLYENYGEAADPWMTLVGYFNSMRELGSTRRLIDDDIQSRLLKMDQRGLARRSRLEVKELTSRINSTDIPVILDQLEVPFIRGEKSKEARKPIDTLLATNMISVGVDVRRLGAMVVTGQPKTTAEYIQATSRVGRTFPGIVFTVYNWARPRDLSHYEQFEHYHATFYQHVESLSITPFAPGATSRGLAALLVSLIRLSGSEFNNNDKAGRIDRNHPYIQAALQTILDRAENVEGKQARTEIEKELKQKLDYWLSQKEGQIGGAELKYQAQKDGVTNELLTQPGDRNWQEFTCLNSLRNVEPTINLVLDDRVPDDDMRAPQPMPKQ
jgi:hypothetical protein